MITITALILMPASLVAIVIVGVFVLTCFAEQHEGLFLAGVAVLAIASIIIFGTLLFCVANIITFRIEEPITYEQKLAEYETLTAALTHTTDIVNTDLYLKIVNYNAEATRYIAAYDNPDYSINFGGKIDWSTLSLVSIPAAP